MPFAEPDATRRFQWAQPALLAILLAAFALRISNAGTYDFWLDEFWTAELSTGRGSVHLDVPHDVVLEQPPRTTQLQDAPPWWGIWTSMERVTHPPLYFLLLRFWREAFGESDFTARTLSVTTSIVAMLLLWDIGRRMVGSTAALWTCALFAVAWPQVEYAQQARNYATLTAIALGMLWAVVRMRQDGNDDGDGWTWPRGAVLFGATLATLLTHYFAAGAVIATFAAVLLCLRGRARRLGAAAMLLAGVAFLIIWGPWMWEQRHVFRTTDSTTAFLVDDGPGHFWRTIARLAMQPGLLLAPLKGPWRWLALAGVVAWVWPLVDGGRRRRLLPAWLWMTGTMAVVALLDFTRSTMHLEFPRYTLLAAPGGYLLIAAACVTDARSPARRWAGHAMAAGITGVALAVTLLTPRDWRDYRTLAAAINQRAHTGDVVVFASPHQPDDWAVGALYLGFDHYSEAELRPVMLLRSGLSGEARERLRRAARIWLVSESTAPPETVLPGFKLVEGGYVRGYPAGIWLMR